MSKQYGIGLALSGGGVRGFAHLGALRALEDNGLKPDIVAGVSAGSVVAVLYAAGLTPDEIMERISSVNAKDILQVDINRSGFLKLDRFRKMLESILPVKTFEELKIPAIVGVTDIDSQEAKACHEGNIASCVTASCSMPLVFKPVKVDGSYCVDGGVMHNLPSCYLRPLCDKIIGVNVSPSKLGKVNLNFHSLAYRIYKIMAQNNVKADKEMCDMLIDITSIQHIATLDMAKAKEMVKKGYFETMKAIKTNHLDLTFKN